MPTSTRGGATAEPPIVARTTAPPIQPPTSKPVALLQQNGFNGDINDFNHRIQGVYNAHLAALGYPPSPGLTLAVARNAQPQDYPGLFSRSSHQQTQTQTVLAADQKQNPDDYYTPDAHGFLQPNTPFGRLIEASKPVQATAAPTLLPHQSAPAAKPQPIGSPTAKQDFNTRTPAATPEQLQASHPWVPSQAGFLPIDGFGNFLKAIGTLSQQGQIATSNGQVTVGGQTLQQYKSQVRQSLIEAPVGQQNVATSELANRSDAITTIKQAQQQLKENFPAYYDGLAADGNFNQDWVSATAKFQSSELYYRSATDRLARDNHFDSPAAFAAAWTEKQRLIQKHPQFAAALQHQPLAFFGNGKSVLNFIDGDAHGWGFINLPTLALNTVIGVGKTVFSEGAAAASYYKANTGFLVNFYHDVLPTWVGGKHMTFDKAHAQATKVLYENPSYLRAFVPDFPAHPTGVLAAADFGSNLALDLFLGNKLVVGGSAVYAGDAKALASSRYFNKSSEWAFNAMREKGLGGVGEASKVLQGGEGLNVAVAEQIKSGDMTLGQFKQHVADLYHHGQTEILLPSRTEINPGKPLEPPQGGFVFHGSPEGVIAKPDPFYATRQWREGVGFYVTEDFGKAKGYAAGRTARGARKEIATVNGAITPVKLKPGIKVLDMDAPADVGLWKKLSDTFHGASTDAEFKQGVLDHLKPGASNREMRDEVLHWNEAMNSEAMQIVAEYLDAQGYKATTHMEGLKTENPHRVWIVHSEDAVQTFPTEARHLRDEIPPTEKVVGGNAIIHADATPNSHVLHSLYSLDTPNPSLPRQAIKQALDHVDIWAKDASLPGTTRAADAVSSLRVLFTRAAPQNDVRRLYDTKTPDDIFNWVVANLKDRQLAYKARNDFVVARAHQDIPAIQDLNQSLLKRYAAEFPNVKGKPSPLEESLGPQTESESLSNFQFLGNRQKATDGALAAIHRKAQDLNQKLLSMAAIQRQAIIAGEPFPGVPFPGGESLFYKHMVADTARRIAGGGGVSFKLDAEQLAAKKEVADFFFGNPAALRDFSANRAGAEQGEYAWQTRGRAESFDNFNTGDFLGTEPGIKQTVKEAASLGLKKNLGVNAKHLEGAGAYLRHLVTDDALNAYRKATETDKTPLFQYVWHSSFYQNKIVKDPEYLADLETLKNANGATRQAVSDLKKTYAQDWAEALWQQYRAIDYAGEIKGVPNALEQASQVAIQHAGAKVDAALGNWIKDNQLAFDVRSAPVKGTQFDSFSQQWIGKLMTFNKLNRKVMFDHVFYDAYSNFVKAGWEKGDAISAATGIAKSQTIYHMLDFSNMLQVEQKFRWVSYYATKHRLYWTWIAKQFASKPGLAAAVGDVGQLLDPSGNLDFTLMGKRLSVPVARLFWVNHTEYPQTSAIIETAARTGKNIVQGQQPVSALANAFSAEVATSGNVIGRDDQAIALATKYVGFLAGAAPATYGFAVKGLSPTQLADFNDHMHGFITAYRADHAGAYPSEADAVKAAALSTALSEGYRSNLFLPVLYQTSRPAPIAKLITEFSNLHDPKKRADFLSKHPQIEDYFGASSDQGLWLHEQPLWDAFNAASKVRNDALNKVRLQMDEHGYNTQLAAEVKAISATYSKAIQAIRTQDAMTWKGDATYPAGKVSDNGEIAQPGPWSQKLDGNPLASQAFIHQAFPAIPHPELEAHTIGQTVLDLQNEETRIKQLGWQQLGYLTPQAAKDRVSQINQKLAVFRGMPRNPTTQMIDAYYKDFVTPYIALRTKLVAAQSKTSAADKNAVYAATRAIKETYDHPVVVTDPVSGKKVTFPSPVSFGFTMLPPDQYHAALAGAAASRWQDITGYEKNLLGVPTPPRVAEGWAAFERTLNEYASQNPGASLVAVQKAGLAKEINRDYPGFLKDYQFAQQPKVDRYEQTTLYKNMQPALRSEFDRYIGGPAKQLAAAIKANGSANYYIGHWRNYVKSLAPWLADPAQKQLKAELAAYGPNFLNTLPSR